MKNRRYVNSVIFLCSLVYFISYITRINYGSVILEIVHSRGITNTAASAALTGSFVTYGVGQLVSGYMGDKIKPVTLIFAGMMISVVMNILLPFMTNVALMTFVWSVNGFAQAFMWPPLVKYLTNLLSTEDYNRASMCVSWGSYIGTVAVYLLAPFCISLLDWRFVFFISAGCGFAMAIIWLVCGKALERRGRGLAAEKKESNEKMPLTEKVHFERKLILMLVFTMAAIVLQGILRDGITTWMPSYIADTYKIKNSVSILTNVVMPVFAIVVSRVILWIYTKKLNNEEVCAGTMFALGSGASLLLYVLCDKSAPVSVFLSAIITSCMHGANMMLISILPGKFKKYGNVSFMSGLLNSCTYIGAALSGYGMALMSQHFGWDGTIFSWAVIAALGAVICFAISKSWGMFLKRIKKDNTNKKPEQE